MILLFDTKLLLDKGPREYSVSQHYSIHMQTVRVACVRVACVWRACGVIYL